MLTSTIQSNRALAVALIATTLSGGPWVSPARAQVSPKVFDFSTETVGGEPRTFTSIVGIWRVEAEGENKVLAVDGRKWQEGQSAAGIADKARALYGERYAEFLDNVQAFAYYPYAVANDVPDFRGGEIAVRFKGVAGRVDQGAGILFDLKPNGDYLALRANPLENNLVLWQYVRGKRTSVKWIRQRPDADRAVARPQDSRDRPEGRRLPGWHAAARAHVAAARGWPGGSLVEGRQLRALR